MIGGFPVNTLSERKADREAGAVDELSCGCRLFTFGADGRLLVWHWDRLTDPVFGWVGVAGGGQSAVIAVNDTCGHAVTVQQASVTAQECRGYRHGETVMVSPLRGQGILMALTAAAAV